MKFFTAEWATGELSDEDYEAAIPAYAEHLSSLSLPVDLEPLAATNLHDAVVEAIERHGDTLTLSLVTGDLQQGYSSTRIRYRGFEVIGDSKELESTDQEPEIIYDEIDRLQDRYVHRLLLSTYTHVEVTFDSVVVQTSPRATRERPRAT
jgi:hypothetical protein